MSVALKIHNYYGFGVYWAESPSVIDPADIYRYIVSFSFWRWRWYWRLGKRH